MAKCSELKQKKKQELVQMLKDLKLSINISKLSNNKKNLKGTKKDIARIKFLLDSNLYSAN